MPITESSRRLVHQLEQRRPAEREIRLPAALGPTIRKVADPVASVEDVIGRLDYGEPVGRAPNGWLQSQAGKTVIRGMRRCCVSVIQRVDSMLHHLPPVSRHQCGTCGSIWEVDYRVREERHHA